MKKRFLVMAVCVSACMPVSALGAEIAGPAISGTAQENTDNKEETVSEEAIEKKDSGKIEDEITEVQDTVTVAADTDVLDYPGRKEGSVIGEVLEEREAGKHFEVVDAQIKGSLFDLSAEDFAKIVLAYEPVWAIGTGKTATSDQAEEIHAHIRATLAAKYGQEIADNCTILYGGSCNASNAKELFAKPNVDGGLIGGASLAVDKFMPIIEAFN